MLLTRFKDGRVHVRKSGMEGLVHKILTYEMQDLKSTKMYELMNPSNAVDTKLIWKFIHEMLELR